MLRSLDLSDNPDILKLPLEMGQLSCLAYLNLRGLKDLSDPPQHLQRDCRDCIRYLNSKLQRQTAAIPEENKVNGKEKGHSPIIEKST